MKLPRLPLTASLLGLTALLFAACEGPDRKELMNEIRHSVPPMAAHETYFDGQVLVRLTLNSNVDGAAYFGGHGHEGASNKMNAMKGSAEGESNFGSSSMGASMGQVSNDMDGGGRGASESKIHAEHSGTYQGNVGMSHIADEENVDSPSARRAREAQMPPALIRLRLDNPGASTMVVEIREVNSDLGNFAIRPDTVTLAPGQGIEVEPMQSLLGVDSYALPVTITLRAGGQTQTKVLTLRPIAPAPGTTPSLPPAR